MKPPDLIEHLIAEIDDSTLIGAVRTAGQRVVDPAHLPPTIESIWLVFTQSRAWMAAATDRYSWAVATGDPSRVAVERGWVTDTVQVGDLRAPLRTGTRRLVERFIAKFVESGGGGESVCRGRGLPDGGSGGKIADGADGVPDWITSSVPAHPDERWLMAVATGVKHPFNTAEGTVETATVFLAASDQQVVLVARLSQGNPLVHQVDRLQTHTRVGRDLITVNGARLLGQWGTDPRLEQIAECCGASPTTRWAIAVRWAIDDGQPGRVSDLWREAVVLGHTEHLGHDAGLMLYSAGDGAGAATALASASDDFPRFNADSWRKKAASVTKALRRTGIEATDVRDALGTWLSSLPPARAMEGQPWPPDNVDEVFGAAASVHQNWDQALSAWTRRPRGPRRATLRAATLQASGAKAVEVANAWTTAATMHREAGSPSQANAALARAIATVETAKARWQAAGWAAQDDLDPTSHIHAALALDPEGQDLDQEWIEVPRLAEQVALLSEQAGRTSPAAFHLAVRAWTQVCDAQPIRGDARFRRAALLEQLGRSSEAVVVVREAACALDADTLESTAPVWAWWCWAARLEPTPSGATDALKRAVNAAFLHSEALSAALTTRPDVLPETLAQWWRHLLGVLEPGPAPEPPALNPSLTNEALTGLHPGGDGWLDRLGRILDNSEPPDHKHLTRGLGRVAPDGETAAAIREVCATLSMSTPTAFVYRGDGAWGVSGWPTSPPALLVGERHLSDPERSLTPAALRFAVAVELAHLKTGHPVLSFDTDLLGTSKSVFNQFGRFAGAAEGIVDIMTLVPGIDQLTKVDKAIRISRTVFRVRSAVDRAGAVASPVVDWLSRDDGDGARGLTREGLQGAALQMRIHADRVAILTTGNVAAAVDAILRTSTHSLAAAEGMTDAGLEAVLADDALEPDETLRISALLHFCAGYVPRDKE